MDCLSCGTDIGNQLGLCQTCKASRTQVRSKKEEVSQPRPLGSVLWTLFSDHPTLLAILVLLPFAFFLIRSMVVDESIAFAANGNKIGLTSADKDSQIVYARGASSGATIRVLDYSVSRLDFGSGAIGGTLAYLTEEEYQEYLKVPGCKAGFLNGHAKFLVVVPHSELARMSQKDLRLKRGNRISVQMTQLTPISVQIKGRNIPPGMWFRNNTVVTLDKVKVL